MGSQRTNIENAVQLALAGATVLTANTRAARSLRHEAEGHEFRTRKVYETPDILPLEAWVSRTWTECLLAGVVERALLKANVVDAFWEQIVANSATGRGLMSHRAAAELAARAWKFVHDYKLPRTRSHYQATAESSAFYGWAENFEERCSGEGWIDSAAALETIIARCAQIPKLPRQLVVFGFDEFTPAQQDLWAALRGAGVDVRILSVESIASGDQPRCLSFADATEEIRTAALWARRKLEESPRARIGVIVPGLESLRGTIETVFAECLHPENSLLSTSRTARSFEMSLGRPLADHAIASTALRLLRLVTGDLPSAELTSLLGSRYLGDGSSEADGRALLDYKLRRKLRATVTLSQLTSVADENRRALAPRLFRLLSDVERTARKLPTRLTRSEWAVDVRRLLYSAGWPGDGPEEFTLSTEEFQVTNAWESLLSAFGALDQVLPPRAPADLVRELQRAAGEATFAIENESAPIRIVGPLAASGESFDALWFCGLTDEAWPQRGHPNPLIPFALQKAVGAPHSSPELNLRAAEQVTARILQSADECILSWPAREEDRELRPSPLLGQVPRIAEEDLSIATVTGWRALQSGASLEEVVDENAPPLADAEVRAHGTSLLSWQSGCPFRAFAQVRLAAEPPDETTLGANPIDRGKVTELALQYVWEEFLGLQNLEQLTAAQVDRGISTAIDKAILEAFPKGEEAWLQQHRDIERARLKKLIGDWLEVERTREPFGNVQHQQDVAIKIGELTVRGRADRIEQTNDGAYVIVDYKTGGASYSPGWWEVPRPQDPQLPIYAVAQKQLGHDIAGVAFAVVRAGNCDFKGEAARKEIFGKTQNGKRYGEFAQVLDSWRPELERLASDFLAGHAEVDPKHLPKTAKSTCRLCHLSALCRIAEIAAPADDEELEEVGDDE
jgi:ATP-dependent helicase/nuclease subunit B